MKFLFKIFILYICVCKYTQGSELNTTKEYLQNEKSFLYEKNQENYYYLRFSNHLLPIPNRFIVRRDSIGTITLKSASGIYLGGPLMLDTITLGVYGNDNAREDIVKGYLNKENLYLGNDLVSIYRMKSNNKLFQTVLSSDKEFIVITGQNRELWKYILDNAIPTK